MINQLDEMIRHLLDTELNEPVLAWTIDVAVRPPDTSWRSAVNANGRPAVNVYMVEIREARSRRTSDASGRRNPEPFFVNCHYIVSTWIPTSDPTFGTPTVVEDWLLGQCVSVLSINSPINAGDIFGATLPPDLEPLLADLDLHTELLPPEGFATIADFWTGMGQGNTWHPSAHLVVTLPIVRSDLAIGPPVTTLHVSTSPTVTTSTSPVELVVDAAIDIGGSVRTAVGDPVAAAWIRLTDPVGTTTIQSATTDADGRYQLVGLAPGGYRLSAGSSSHARSDKTIEIPTAVGDYDLVLT